MKYFKNSAGVVFAFDSAQVKAGFAEGMSPMTAADVSKHTAAAGAGRQDVEAARLIAYADPVTGSDRYFAEAARLQAMGAPQDDIDAAIASGLARYGEIQAEHPWP